LKNYYLYIYFNKNITKLNFNV